MCRRAGTIGDFFCGEFHHFTKNIILKKNTLSQISCFFKKLMKNRIKQKMLWELTYNVKGCSRFSTGKNSLWRKIIQQTPLYTTACSKSQLMKFLWEPILTPPNKIVIFDTNSVVPTPNFLRTFVSTQGVLLGHDPTGDKVLSLIFRSLELYTRMAVSHWWKEWN